jgi:Flp pilus assembly pilin Flp
MSGQLPSDSGRGPIVARHHRGANMRHFLCELWLNDDGQDIAEYTVMLAVILAVVVGTARLVGSNANAVFPSVASSLQ